MTDINYPASGGGGGAGGAVDLNDGAGNPITSQVSGSKRALDVGVNVAGVQIDPRNIRMDVGGTPTAVPGNSLGILTSTPYATFIGTLTAPTTGVIISSIDCANYRFVSFYVTMSVGSFTLQLQGSNDNTNWVAHPFNSFTSNLVINTTTNTAGIYTTSIMARYIRFNVTAIATGTLTVTAVVFDNTRVDSGNKYVTLSGTSATTTYLASRTRTINVRYNYATGTVTTAAYTQILASTSAATASLWIADTSGSAIILATGAAGSEVDQLYIPPGGFEGFINLGIAASTRLSIKALDTNASTGQLIINGLA